MLQFSPGESKTAVAPILAKPTGMDCEAELFLGPDELTKVVSSGRVPLVSTGAAKNVSLPIVMPAEAGSYHGYIDVLTENIRFLAYILKEDVVIVPPAMPFDMTITKINTTKDKYATAYWLMEVIATIANPHSAPVTHQIRCIACSGYKDPDDISSYNWTRRWETGEEGLTISLMPGESVSVVSPFYYIIPLGEANEGRESENRPLGMYHGGVKKKYWFRIIDEQNYWSPVASVGTYV